MSSATRTRVVVADDSGLMRRVVTATLEHAGFDVVGAAKDGDEALALCERERPDAMTLDLAMPGLDGIGVLRALRRQGERATPVVVVSAFSPAHGARAVDALAEGAFDLVAKPAVGDGIDRFTTELSDKVRLAAASRRRAPGRAAAAAPRAPLARSRPGSPLATPSAATGLGGSGRLERRARAHSGTRRIVVIACSTGGPKALAELVPALPAPLGAGTLIVQHMPPGFTNSLAARLDRASNLNVREAAGGEALDPKVALLAPGGAHLRLADPSRVVSLSDAPEIGGLRPRADLTIADAAKAFGERMVLVVLTGMGKDGLEGAQAVRRRGGRVLVEAESTCTVYGMPRAVAEADLAHEILPLHELPAAIAAEAGA
ncbi:chemotaxis-specific protein-glutamate methyltransferase CheB [Conexibacter stalactiti]|uniref:Protein-glutamate methylesterase/protein-glutamine glutaminase n=1 Tax=Conexibacter stalactiti TaxID=1940611 RepID=A0ABU4HWJ1_9ACTN|nr:chemotaxis-specific protein-glutamate methyltransferase CheB [Conexibacter stalactiti]MDW5597692.1 chemotaxis-specific protein-glutamate methyltransferase CheB [Conexibacter stalactiti]MEC5038334.1 chemotaxis-specific protein-glutamate methyltransferase CheB [Conexibacter stalactiti]